MILIPLLFAALAARAAPCDVEHDPFTGDQIVAARVPQLLTLTRRGDRRLLFVELADHPRSQASLREGFQLQLVFEDGHTMQLESAAAAPPSTSPTANGARTRYDVPFALTTEQLLELSSRRISHTRYTLLGQAFGRVLPRHRARRAQLAFACVAEPDQTQ